MRRGFFYGWVIVATLFVVNFATHSAGNMNLGLFVISMSDEIGISCGIFDRLTTSRTLAAGLASITVPSRRHQARHLLLVDERPFDRLRTGFMEAGKQRLSRDTTRDATRQEIDDLKRESTDLKVLVAEFVP